MDSRLKVKSALILSYIVIALLLNSVGTVILQVINTWQISTKGAGILEGFKDIPIAVGSFLLAAWIPRLGYKISMIIALILVMIMCLILPLFPSFNMVKIMFLITGISFALIKVSVYSSVGLITYSKEEHASVMSLIEGFFSLGVLSSYWTFSIFIDPNNPTSLAWLNTYYLLSTLCLIALILLINTKFPKEAIKTINKENLNNNENEYINMFKLLILPLIYIFIVSAFLYVLIEQAINSWLPTFNNKIIELPNHISVLLASLIAVFAMIGRWLASFILKYISWCNLINICLVCVAIIILLVMPLTHNVAVNENVNLLNAPFVAYLLPLTGLFLGPIYPLINSAILSALPKSKHAAMTGLIVIFSALGGTSGSMLCGYIFDIYDGQTAFYLCLVPLSLLIITLNLFNKKSKNIIVKED